MLSSPTSVISASAAPARSTSAARIPAGPAPMMTKRVIARTPSLQAHVLVVDGEVVDAAVGRRDPCRHLAGLDDALHQALDEGAVALRGNPAREPGAPLGVADELALGCRELARPGADRAPEARARQLELDGQAGLLDE